MKSLVALVGMQFRPKEAQALLKSLPNGEPLTLVRDPANPHDRKAVEVWARGVHVGFVKGSQNAEIAARMDSAARTAKVAVTSLMTPAKLALDGGRWPMVEID
jgi:DNA-binding NarL/FixJ family response regulator